MIRFTVLAVLAFIVATKAGSYTSGNTVYFRNFYGALYLEDGKAAGFPIRTLFNGNIEHGSQFLSPEKARTATTYYGKESGGGLTLLYPRPHPSRVGVIGLGAGTLASYARPGDSYRFYELNPLVIGIANTQFHYLRDCGCDVTVVPGDGRIALETEPPQNFDVIVVDAFSGDSIPVHLLTREAFTSYIKHLRPDGVLAFHVSNRYLDLAPVVKALAAERGLQSRFIHSTGKSEPNLHPALWVLSSADSQFLASLAPRESPFPPARRLRPWTDDYSALFQVLR